MTSDIALWVALASGAFALIGSLGSQAISGLIRLKAKRLEIVYARKVEGYAQFMQRASGFLNDPAVDENYGRFLHAYFGAVIIASQPVIDACKGHGGIYSLSRSLHNGKPGTADYKNNYGHWTEVLEDATREMRNDLQRFARH